MEAIPRGREGFAVMAADSAVFRYGRIYDDIDEMQSDLSDMLRYEAMVIKCVKAKFFWVQSHRPAYSQAHRRGDCAGANGMDDIQRKHIFKIHVTMHESLVSTTSIARAARLGSLRIASFHYNDG